MSHLHHAPSVFVSMPGSPSITQFHHLQWVQDFDDLDILQTLTGDHNYRSLRSQSTNKIKQTKKFWIFFWVPMTSCYLHPSNSCVKEFEEKQCQEMLVVSSSHQLGRLQAGWDQWQANDKRDKPKIHQANSKRILTKPLSPSRMSAVSDSDWVFPLHVIKLLQSDLDLGFQVQDRPR